MYPSANSCTIGDANNPYLCMYMTTTNAYSDYAVVNKAYLKSNIQYGLIPQMTTGTTGTSAGYYTSSHVTITFAKPFNNPPAVMFQENGGNAERFYRYRIVGYDSTMITLCLIANAPSYTPIQGTYIAIGY